jgi:hypothetical protein
LLPHSALSATPRAFSRERYPAHGELRGGREIAKRKTKKKKDIEERKQIFAKYKKKKNKKI